MLQVAGGAVPAQAQMTLPGSLTVNETGAAIYTIPIEVPPGTAGMAPKLSLQYSSRGGNGLIGIGWSLAGLPAITRCPQTLAQDGVKGSINFDAWGPNDRFCLEGERLVAINGTYGANGTEYRLEREGFSKIVSYGSAGTGPVWFKLWTKSGQIMEFGNTEDSRIQAAGRSEVLTWTINRVADTAGNYWTVSYDENSSNSEYRPTRIDYTANDSMSAQPQAFVTFTYEGRTDFNPVYEFGSRILTTQRLTNIKTYVKTPSAALVKDYRLTYAYSATTLRSRLTSLQLCDGASICQPAIAFSWQDSGPPTGSGSLANVPGDVNEETAGPRWFIVDNNGDGRQDIVARGGTGDFMVYQSNGTTLVPQGYVSTGVADRSESNYGRSWFQMEHNADLSTDFMLRLGGSFIIFRANGTTFSYSGQENTGYTDYYEASVGPRYFLTDNNGDGRQDLLIRNPGGSLFGLYLADATDFTWAANLTSGYTDQSPSLGPKWIFSDVNGDGKEDLVVRDYTNYTTYLSNGAGYTTGGTLVTHLGHVDESVYGQRFFFMDVNGDGRQDIVLRDHLGQFFTYLAWGNSFVNTGNTLVTPYGDRSPSLGQRYFVMDVNGDGKQDLVIRGTTNFDIYLSTGAGFAQVGSLTTHIGDANETTLGKTWFVMDMNGDGRQDLIIRDGAGWFYTYFSTGWGFTSCSNAPPSCQVPMGPFASGHGNKHTNLGQRYFVMDVNGDGRQEFVMRDGTNFTVYIVSGGQPDLMTAILEGTGKQSAITYKPIADGGTLYARDTAPPQAAVYPNFDIQGPIHVVSKIATSNGINGTPYETSYRYVGAKANVQGRGFLGFRQTIVKDEQTGIEQTTSYRQDWPYLGLVASRKKATTGGSPVELNKLDNTYAAGSALSPATSPSRYFVSLSESLEQSRELNGAEMPAVKTSYVYDAYGNPTTVTVATGSVSGASFTGDGYSKVTTNSYFNDTTNWWLGRLTQAIVASTSP